MLIAVEVLEQIYLKHVQNEEFKQPEEEAKVEIKKPPVQTFDEHAMGCLIGALVGDSCGSMHQFAYKPLSEVELDFCFTMPGGGHYQLNPGQVTDDGELMLCLMHALTTNCTPNLFDLDEIVKYYKKWAETNPPYIEELVEETIYKLKDGVKLNAVKKFAREKKDLVTNSALQSIMPVAIWAADIDDFKKFEKIIITHTELIQGNPLAHHAAVIYARCLGYLLKNIN